MGEPKTATPKEIIAAAVARAIGHAEKLPEVIKLSADLTDFARAHELHQLTICLHEIQEINAGQDDRHRRIGEHLAKVREHAQALNDTLGNHVGDDLESPDHEALNAACEAIAKEAGLA